MGLQLIEYGANGAKVWQDDRAPYKVYGAVGEGARSWALKAGLPCDDTTLRPDEFVNTLTGTSPITAGVAAGYPLLITTGGTDYNGVNMQLRGESATLAANKFVWLRGKIKLSVDLQSDLLFGLCELKTDLLNTSASHAVTATNVAGVFFHHAAHASVKTLYLRVYVAGALTSSVAVGDLAADADIDYALWWDGVRLHAYIDGTEVATVSSSLPTGELTPSINVRTGAAAAVTANIAELAYVSIE
jgi:hypothetical protein